MTLVDEPWPAPGRPGRTPTDPAPVPHRPGGAATTASLLPTASPVPATEARAGRRRGPATEWMAARRRPSQTLLRFALVGAAGVMVNEAALALLHHGLAVPLVLASVVATEVAVVTNYAGNELWTFSVRRLSWPRLARFQVTAVGGLLVTAGALALLTALTGLSPLLVNPVAVALGSVWNFVLNVRWTWKGAR